FLWAMLERDDMISSINFDIFNKVKLCARSYDKKYLRALKRLKIEYDYFKHNVLLADPDIIVEFDRITLKGKYSKVDNFYVGSNFVFSSDSYKIAKWKILVEGIESDKIIVKLEPNFFTVDLIPPLFVTPIISYVLFRKGISLIHGGGISIQKRGVIITGFSGSGKTSSILELAREEEIKIMGDDHVILDKGNILAFPTALSLFKYNIPPNLNSLGGYKRELLLKFLIKKLTFGYIYPVTKVPLKDIFPGSIVNESKLWKIILIEPKNTDKVEIEQVEKDEIVKIWIKNIIQDFKYFYKYLLSYYYCNSQFRDYFEEIQSTLYENLGQCKDFIRLSYPKINKKSLFKCLKEELEL
ncbi:MAG: hypothetical protein N3A69_05220, partial [Leptospiraceae bacterium]|nr:hypothetical protein [Leptospiraceae bacterium]